MFDNLRTSEVGQSPALSNNPQVQELLENVSGPGRASAATALEHWLPLLLCARAATRADGLLILPTVACWSAVQLSRLACLAAQHGSWQQLQDLAQCSAALPLTGLLSAAYSCERR